MHSDLSWLLSQPLDPLAARFDGAASTTVTIVAAHAYRLQAVACDMPLLLVPLLPATGWLAVKAPAPIHAPAPAILAPATPVQSLPAQ
ncbi:MAG: hypothetical protein RSH52_17025 [Janthinobacterium sp.]